jgi:class 3 adenylate cyclase/tetratricopeptide (TPR) repeat protein
VKKLLPLYLILSAFISFAQNETIDSLQQALKNYDAQKLELRKNLLPDKGDTTKVIILENLFWEFYLGSDNVTAKKYAEDAMALAQRINYKKGIASSYNIIGLIYDSQGNYPEALKNHFASLKTSEEAGSKKGIADSYGNIGNIYYEQGNYPEALKYNFVSLKISEETGDKKGIAHSYNNIGVIYQEQGNYPEALKNYLASLKIKEEVGDKHGIAGSYNNIGAVYEDQGNHPEAMKNYFSALKIWEEIGDKGGIADCYTNIGAVYEDQGNYADALNNFFAALKIYEEIGDKNRIAASCNSIGQAKTKTHMAASGKDWLLKGLTLAKEIGSVDVMKSSYEGFAKADSALGNFKGAYENHKLFIQYRDSLNNEENTKKTTQMQMQYEFDKKESETKVLTDAELNKQKLVRNGFMGGFAVVLAFAGVFFRQRNKIKNEKQRSDALLLNILPGEVADEIKISGTAKAKAFTMVTVMFTDFKDFTTVSEKISAELLVDEIHTCFSAFDNILHKYNIEKIKTIGDAYLCASGLPVSNHTHAVDMLNAAFEIRSFMLERKKEKEANGEIPFELRIGIHTGPVVAGVVGVKKYAYDIWGDTVNIAARMEQNSEAGKINISGTTYELVKVKFKCEHRGKIQAKNKGEIDMYYAEAVS